MSHLQRFVPGEYARPHYNFRHHYPEAVNDVIIKTVEKGFCESGWLVTICEWPGQYDQGWFFKIENSKKMNIDNLDKAVELKQLLTVTKKALADTEKALQKSASPDKKSYNKGPFRLVIGEHTDGSGWQVNLNRYYGNDSVLQVIKNELVRQINFFEQEIELL